MIRSSVRFLPLCLILFAGCAKEPELSKYGQSPQFSLTERSSRTVESKELQGNIWVADFIFTRCGGTCPLMTAQMRKLQDQLPTEIRLVSFSVDPTYDTPPVLSEYANQHGADPNRWWFLTGQRDEMYRISKDGFKLAVDDTQGTPSEPITHSTRFALVDRAGTIRGYYGMEDEGAMSRLIEDAKKLL